MDNKRLSQVSIVALTILLLALLFTQISFNDIIKAISSIGMISILISFTFYILSYLVRSLRFSMMLNERQQLPGMFNIVCIHNMANNIMPFKTGELAFIYLARVKMGVSAGIGVATVALARMYDALAISVLFLIFVLLFAGGSGTMARYVPAAVLITVVLIICIVLLLRHGNRISGILKKLCVKRFFNNGIFHYLISKIDEAISHYSKPRSEIVILKSILLSFIIWMLNISAIFFLVKDMGLGINIELICAGILASVMFTAIPIQGIGNFETTELFWSVVFIALGSSKEIAISSGFAMHVIVLGFAAILGIFGLMADRFRSRS